MPRSITQEQKQRIIALEKKCWTQERIAEELGVNRSTVSRVLTKYNQAVFDRLIKRHASIKAAHANRIERIVDEAMQAWERSKLDAESIKTVTGDVPGKDGAPVTIERTETTIKGQTGNPAYLAQAVAALGEIRKVLGIDPNVVDMSNTTKEQLEAILTGAGIRLPGASKS